MRLMKFTLAISCFFLLLSGCGDSGGGGTDRTEVELATDGNLPLSCKNVGIYPETCILDDPDNPYINSYISEELKWELHDASPSAKSRYYLWATVLARTPNGENQYYTASALHELYTEGGSTNAKEQAIRAYQSVLDNFYDDVTYFIADWLPEQPFYEVRLRDLTGQRLYDPSGDNLSALYDDPNDALDALEGWGYYYDVDSGELNSL
jgi:hypothetical protein